MWYSQWLLVLKYDQIYLRRLSKLFREPPPPPRCSPSTSPTSSYFSPWRYCSLWCWWKWRQWWWRQGQRWLFEAGPPSPFPFSAFSTLVEPWSNSDLHLPHFHHQPLHRHHESWWRVPIGSWGKIKEARSRILRKFGSIWAETWSGQIFSRFCWRTLPWLMCQTIAISCKAIPLTLSSSSS